MSNQIPDSSAVRTALWRALHVQIDATPHLIEDEIGLALVQPEEDWRDRGDMHPFGTMPYRAAIVARTRFLASATSPTDPMVSAPPAARPSCWRAPDSSAGRPHPTGPGGTLSHPFG